MLAYTVLDVFAEHPFEGNALAVVHDARGLSDEMMQRLAREMNLSETAFVLPGTDPGRDRREGVRVRIFTTEEELPFAGHPTLGTASWLHLFYPPLQGAREVTLRCNVGPIPVRFEPIASAPAGESMTFGTMRQNDPVFGEEYDSTEVAGVLGLTPGDLLPGYPPQSVSTGNPFCIVALRSLEVLSRLAIPQARATAWLRAKGIRWFYCIAPASEGEAAGRARMQFYNGEDPATGSAAGPCIAWLVRQGLARSGEPVVLEQGVEMRRPSRLTLRATQSGERITGVEVSGRTVRVATGHLFLPVHQTFTQQGEP